MRFRLLGKPRTKLKFIDLINTRTIHMCQTLYIITVTSDNNDDDHVPVMHNICFLYISYDLGKEGTCHRRHLHNVSFD